MDNISLTIHAMTREDAKLLFQWRNDIETRKNSTTTEAILWETHMAWVEKVLSGGFPGRAVYLIEEGGKSVGMIRSDERPDGYVEVSYSIAPEMRGKGLGKRMVLQFVREKLSGRNLAARIRKNTNPASEALARTLGLSPYSEESIEDGTTIVEWR